MWADTIRELAADLNSICERRKLLAENIEAVFKAHPLGKIISTMCGFGPTSRSKNPRRNRRPTPLHQRQQASLLRWARTHKLAVRQQNNSTQTGSSDLRVESGVLGVWDWWGSPHDRR